MTRAIALAALALAASACAARRQPPDVAADSPAVQRLQGARTCVVDALLSAGYQLDRPGGEPRHDQVHVAGSIRMPLVSAGDPALRDLGPRVVGQAPAPENGYTLDRIEALLALDATGMVHVTAGAYTGVSATANSGYTPGRASLRGDAAAKAARACADVTEPER